MSYKSKIYLDFLHKVIKNNKTLLDEIILFTKQDIDFSFTINKNVLQKEFSTIENLDKYLSFFKDELFFIDVLVIFFIVNIKSKITNPNLIVLFKKTQELYELNNFLVEEVNNEKRIINYLNFLILNTYNDEVDSNFDSCKDLLDVLISSRQMLESNDSTYPLPFLLFNYKHWRLFDYLLSKGLPLSAINKSGTKFINFLDFFKKLNSIEQPSSILYAKIQKEIKKESIF